MHIYLNLNAIEDSVSFEGKTPYLFGRDTIQNYETAPYITYSGDIEMLLHNKKIEKMFLKATDVQFPKFYPVRRELGLYRLGKAKGELLTGENSPFCLKLETKTWMGMLHMKLLQSKLQAGSIYPVINYESGQKKKHLLTVLEQILAVRKLTAFKRFILAFRLLGRTKQFAS